MRVEFLHARMKARWDEGGGIILLGDNIDGGGWWERGETGGNAAVDMFQCVAVWSSTGLPWTYTQLTTRILNCHMRKIRLAPNISKRNYRACRGAYAHIS